MSEFERRRDHSTRLIDKLKASLLETEELIKGKACVYATGSYGRLEASDGSDLDLFIVGTLNEKKPALNRLDEVVVKADLIRATRELKLPEFDGDGEYLGQYTSDDLIGKLGKPEDDQLNTFTARLLLLLESKPLLGGDIYNSVVLEVVRAYWKDYKDHQHNYSPAFLLNDILRLWRTFCVNYEARTRSEPEQQKLKRRVKNYKLKHGRMLTCFSAVTGMLAIYRKQGTVHPEDFIKLIQRTPIERINALLEDGYFVESHESLRQLVSAYDRYLDRSKVGSTELALILAVKENHRNYTNEADDFVEKMRVAIISIGGESQLARNVLI